MRKASLIILFVLFVTACNPIPPEPSTPSPLFSMAREKPIDSSPPLQADVYDFAFALKQFEPGVTKIEIEAYAALLLEISACLMEQFSIEEDSPYTTGQEAAFQWVVILWMMDEVYPSELRDPQSPNIYNSLTSLLNECRDPDSSSFDEQEEE
ncbi:MAG: hypothetical protein OXI52_00710 [Caldilineaceae bacterium]|nr:hypothetical protein [Caldilineaceae bacterium]